MLFWFVVTQVCADVVSVTQAEAVARRFFSGRGGGKGVKALAAAPRLAARGVAGGYYLFVPSQGQGFVVVAGDDRLPEVLAYGNRSLPNDDTCSPAFAELLRAYDCAAHNVVQTASRMPGQEVLPLLKSVRHQEEPYNGLCPYYTDSKGNVSKTRCLVGCVATSVEQIMTYYRHPTALRDTLYGWTTPNYTIDTIAPGAVIDWDHILPDYSVGYTEEEARAIQQLSLYCGMGCRMQYGVNASGAELREFMNTLRRVFGYEYARFYDRSLYSPVQWNRMLRHELEQGRPVAYTGHNVELSGHAFVVDGVDAAGYYHLNWGYGGSYDGYFDLDVLNPFETLSDPTEVGRYEGFFCNQTALFMHPDAVEPLPVDSLSLKPEDVSVDGVEFGRQPDTQGYVPVHFRLTNHRSDTLTYTFEVMTFLPSDTAVFRQAEYVGLSGATLLPGQTTRVTAYCRFRRTGDFLFGCSCDDENIACEVPVTVTAGQPSRLYFGNLWPDELTADTVRFLLPVSNDAPSGSDGSLITYCLFCGDEPDDIRHWTFLNLPAGTSCTDTVMFSRLRVGCDYVLKVRCPWAVVAEYAFRLSDPTAVTDTGPAEGGMSFMLYNLQGMWLGKYSSEARMQSALPHLPAGCYVVRRSDGSTFKVMSHSRH